MVDVPYLRVANVQRGFLNLRTVKTIDLPEQEVGRYSLELGDVVMTEGGDWDKLGRAAVWRGEVERCIHQNHVFCIRSASVEELLPEWLELAANSPDGRTYFAEASKQTTNLASINMTQLRAFPLLVPPSSEQRRIVAKVNELMTLCDQLEEHLKAGDVARSQLLDALIAETLAGRHAWSA